MLRSSAAQRSSISPFQALAYPADLLPELQSALAALADVEVRYETAREHLQVWTGPDAIKMHLVADLEARYRSERDRCDQRLTGYTSG